MNLYGYANGDPVNFSDPFGLCTPWPECWFQSIANWGARRGGTAGDAAVFVGAATNAASEAAGTNSIGAEIGEGDVIGATIAVGLTFFPGGKIGRGLRNASTGLKSLFAAGGGLADNTLAGIRSTLLDNGFTMGAAESGTGYLFSNAAGEQVRLMRGDSGWYMRVMNKFGNYLDELGNPGSRAATHLDVANR